MLLDRRQEPAELRQHRRRGQREGAPRRRSGRRRQGRRRARPAEAARAEQGRRRSTARRRRSRRKEFADANGLTTGLSGGSGKVVVGAANFPESQTLAELYKIALTAAGFNATVQQSTNREVYEPALERGEITVFPEYAATLTEFLNKKANGENAPPKASGDINATMTALKELGDKYGLTFGTPSAASDQNAFAVTKPVADKYGLKTLSDFAAKCSGTASVLAGPPECPQRPFCQPGLKDTYGITFGAFFQADAGGPQTKTALKTGKATLGLVFSSDSSLHRGLTQHLAIRATGSLRRRLGGQRGARPCTRASGGCPAVGYGCGARRAVKGDSRGDRSARRGAAR